MRPVLLALLTSAVIGSAYAQSADYWYDEARRLVRRCESELQTTSRESHGDRKRIGRVCDRCGDDVSGAVDKALAAGNYDCHMEPECKKKNKERYDRITPGMFDEIRKACQHPEGFLVIRITPGGEATVEVGLRDPLSGEVHSVSIAADVGRLLRIGDRVRERRGRNGISLDRAEPRQEIAQPEEEPPPTFLFPGEQPAEAANIKRVPCADRMTVPCDPPKPPPPGSTNPRPFKKELVKTLLGSPPGLTHVKSMSFVYDSAYKTKNRGRCDVLASGSFTGGGLSPAGPFKIRDRVVNSAGKAVTIPGKTISGYSDKRDKSYLGDKPNPSNLTTLYRGSLVLAENRVEIREGTAWTNQGTARIVRQSGNKALDLAPDAVMGGGALLVHGGMAIPEDELCCCQGFITEDTKTHVLYPDKCGFRSGQLQPGGYHIIVACRGSDMWVFASDKGGEQVQKDLLNAGFDEGLLLDGGRGAFMVDGNGVIFDGRWQEPNQRSRPAEKNKDTLIGANATRLCIMRLP